MNESKICSLYQKLQRCDKVASMSKCHPKTVSRILKKHGIKVVRHGWKTIPPKSRYTLREDKFTKHCSEMFYFLGFLFCDGYVTKNRNSHVVGLSVAQKDTDILEKFKHFLGSNKPILFSSYKASQHSVVQRRKQQSDRLYHMARIAIYSEFIYKELETWGIVRNKTKSMVIRRNVPKKYAKDFIRGCLDADGCISMNNKNVECYISSGSAGFLKQIQEMVLSETGILMTKSDNGSGCGLIKLTCSKCAGFLNWLYSKSYIYLNRKKQLADKCIELHGL